LSQVTSYAVAPDGAILMGFPSGVARLSPDGGKDLLWLCGEAPGAKKTGGVDVAGKLVAADAQGRIFIIDQAFAGRLYLAGTQAPGAKVNRMVVLGPGEGPEGRTLVTRLGITLAANTPFGFTPEGHLTIADNARRSLRIIPNELAP
jgi:hypothetical protein